MIYLFKYLFNVSGIFKSNHDYLQKVIKHPNVVGT